jgi:hypothetical protein
MVLENTDKSGIFNLTDGCHPSFKDIESCIAAKMGLKSSRHLPLRFAKLLSVVGELFPFFPFNKSVLKKMTLDLTFNDARAISELNWQPTDVRKALSKLDY